MNLLIKNICDNSNKINNLSKHIVKVDRRTFIEFLVLGVTVHMINRIVEKHEDKINELEHEIKEMKSKGE